MAERPEVQELGIPPDAVEKGGAEVFRAFVVDRGLSVSLQRAFEDPETWGMLLVDIARHVARIYALETDLEEAEVLARIKAMLDSEWDEPTDTGSTTAMN